MTQEQLYEERRAFWAQRSHEDAKAVNDHARAAVQTLILVNGGAATALLAFASSSGASSLSSNIMMMLGLSCFAIGVAIGAYNIRVVTDTGVEYLAAWTGWGLRDDEVLINEHLEKAKLLNERGRHCFSFSIGFFLVGCLLLGITIIFGS